jgi:hypothetical protein
MRIIRKSTPVIIIIAICGLLFLGYGYTRVILKSFIYNVSKRDFGATVSIKHIELGFPLSLRLKDVAVNDTIKAASIVIYPKPAALLLNKRFLFSKVKINDLVVRIVRQKDSLSFFEGVAEDRKDKKISQLPNFHFSKIDINNATLIYEDREKSLEFVDIKGTIERPGFYFSRKNIYQFSFAGFLKNKDSDFLSPVRIKGKGGSDGAVNADLRLKDILISSLSNFYLGQFDIIEGETADLKSEININGNNLIAKCGLQMKKEDKSTPFLASFVLLFNLKSKILKIKNLHGNFLNSKFMVDVAQSG